MGTFRFDPAAAASGERKPYPSRTTTCVTGCAAVALKMQPTVPLVST
jgi:hypothetical protein